MSFVERGIKLQVESGSVRRAESAFRYSCKLCSERGLHINCDSCGIRNAHEIAVEVYAEFEALREIHDKQRNKRAMKEGFDHGSEVHPHR